MAPSSTPSNEWTILYHDPGHFKGRGEFLRLMLEDAGVSYTNTADDIYGPSGLMDCFRGSTRAINDDDTPYPIFYPPAIWHRPPGGEEVLINQSGACMIYIGEVLGYAPTTPAERARADCILLNCMDYIAEGRLSFHPLKIQMSYYDQKEEADMASKQFAQGRMKRWLHHFQKAVKRNGPEAPVAGGAHVTYADFALFHVLDATIAQFNNDFYENVWDNSKGLKKLKEYHAWMKHRPNLLAYFESDRCAPYSGDSMM